MPRQRDGHRSGATGAGSLARSGELGRHLSKRDGLGIEPFMARRRGFGAEASTPCLWDVNAVAVLDSSTSEPERVSVGALIAATCPAGRRS